jgi:hypothetical protein
MVTKVYLFRQERVAENRSSFKIRIDRVVVTPVLFITSPTKLGHTPSVFSLASNSGRVIISQTGLDRPVVGFWDGGRKPLPQNLVPIPLSGRPSGKALEFERRKPEE